MTLANSSNNELVEKLVFIKKYIFTFIFGIQICRPVLRIPSLAIHLDRAVNSSGFVFNTELQLNPILASLVMDQKFSLKEPGKDSEQGASHHAGLERILKSNESKSNSTFSDDTDGWSVLNLLVPEEIVSMDLSLYDTQKASIGGIYDEFIISSRLDNLMLSFCTAEVRLNVQEAFY